MDLLFKINLGINTCERGEGSRKRQRVKLSYDVYPISALANGMNKP